MVVKLSQKNLTEKIYMDEEEMNEEELKAIKKKETVKITELQICVFVSG